VKKVWAGRGRSFELINQHELEGTEGNLKADFRSFSNSKEWKMQSFKSGVGDILNWALGNEGKRPKENEKGLLLLF
jgi:hypothetical protein